MYKYNYMILHNTNKGASPVIGVILLVAVFTGVVILLSFNLFSSNIGVVSESMDADISFNTISDGVNVQIHQNENINRLYVQYEDGRLQEIDINSNSEHNVTFGPGRYDLIGENDSNRRLIGTNRVQNSLEIDVETFVSTNEELQYNFETNIHEDEIDSYEWDFGNGEISTEKNPTNTYFNDGIFTTELIITLNDNSEISTDIDITVDSSTATSSEPEDIEEVHNNLDGDGTTQTPYIIMDDHDLQSISVELDANYELGQNINASKTNQWNEERGFKPLGNATSKFTGEIDGQGYSINELTINRNNTSYIGLIGYTKESKIENIILTNIDITGQSEVGGLVGYNQNSTINNSSVEGTVIGDGNLRLGGLVGYNKENSIINSSYSIISIRGENNNLGGLVGKNENSSINKSFSKGNLEGENNNLGGLVGANELNGEINNSYSQIDITGFNNTYVGGLVGYNKNGLVTNTYSANLLQTDGITGGLIGRNDDSISNSYWNEEISESTLIGNNTGDETNNTGLSTIEMQGENSSENMTALDFDNIWRTVTNPNNDYPELQN